MSVPGYDPTCPEYVGARVTRIELNASDPALRYEYLGTDFTTERMIKTCAFCRWTEAASQEIEVELDAEGSGTFSIPADLGPGRFLVEPIWVSGDELQAGDPLFHLVTAKRFADADHAARRAMQAHAASLPEDDAYGRELHEMAASQRHFLRFAPDGEGDRLVEVFGEIEGAAHVAVTIPGFSSSVEKGHELPPAAIATPGRLHSNSWVWDAERLWARSAADYGAETTTVIAYLGYAPPGTRPGNWADVTVTARAELGASELLRDLRAWSIDDRTHLTTIGHSYGSTMLGIATASADTGAADVAFIGSPGVGIYASDQLDFGPVGWGALSDLVDEPTCRYFAIDGCCPEDDGISCLQVGDRLKQVWVGRYDEDGVVNSTGDVTLGVTPHQDSFGAREFHTEPSSCDNDWGPYNPFGNCHSVYYDWNQESLRNLARIANGDRSSVTLVKETAAPPVVCFSGCSGDRLPWIDPPTRVYRRDVVAVTESELGSMTLPGDVCSVDSAAPKRLVDGSWTSANGNSHLQTILTRTGDIDGDGFDDGLVALTCEFGASSTTNAVVAMIGPDRKVVEVGFGADLGPARGVGAWVDDIAIAARKVEVRYSDSVEGEPNATRSFDVIESLKLASGRFKRDKVQLVGPAQAAERLVAAINDGDAVALSGLSAPELVPQLQGLAPLTAGSATCRASGEIDGGPLACTVEDDLGVLWTTTWVRRGFGDFQAVSLVDDGGD